MRRWTRWTGIMASALTRVYVHVVWTTHRRRFRFAESLRQPLESTLREKCLELGCTPMAIGVAPDHVHILLRLHPALSIAKLVGQLKGASAYLLCGSPSWPTGFRWQDGYAAFSVAPSGLAVARAYVLHQWEKHTSSGGSPRVASGR